MGKENFHYIATSQISEQRLNMGFPVLTASYAMNYTSLNKLEVDKLIDEADAVIIGAVPFSVMKRWYKKEKIIFHSTERLYKSISRYLKFPIHSCRSLIYKKGFILCSGAFVAKDFMLSGFPIQRCFRWGYFTEFREYNSIERLITSKDGESVSGCISILWAGRFLQWKHPDAAICLAKRLRKDGIPFKLRMIGTGVLERRIKKQIEDDGLGDYVQLIGKMPPNDVRNYMEVSDIFIFTSDRFEGWGAVLNESMNSACAVVASDMIGSVPYLIKDGENGLIYKNGNNKILYQKVRSLIDNSEKRHKLQKSAYFTMRDEWSPKRAANNFVKLVEVVRQGALSPFETGPCSMALPFHVK